MKKIIVFIFLSLFLLKIGTAEAFGVSPSSSLLTLDPGSSKTITLEIENNEKKDLKFVAKVFGVRQKNDGTPEFLSGYLEAERWAKPKVDSVYIGQGQKGKVDFAINVPTDAVAGSYYLALAVRPSSLNDDGIGLTGQVVSLLNLQVSGLVNEFLKINKWEFDKSKSDADKWKFVLNLQNEGSVEVVTTANLSISTWGGREIMKEKVSLGNKLLPYSFRFLQPEIKSIRQAVFWPGYYQAKISIDYGRTGQSISVTDYVWYCPPWAYFLLVFVPIVFVLIGYSIKRIFYK